MAKQLEILNHPHPTLREKSIEFDLKKLSDPEIKQLLLDMEETMLKKDGAGLAAPQIGQNIRITVVNDNNESIFLINPKIIKRSWARETEEEGCLSVLNDQGQIIYGKVERPKKITCTYFNEKGEKKKIKADRILSRIIQHEVDHLDGILFIDKVKE